MEFNVIVTGVTYQEYLPSGVAGSLVAVVTGAVVSAAKVLKQNIKLMAEKRDRLNSFLITLVLLGIEIIIVDFSGN